MLTKKVLKTLTPSPIRKSYEGLQLRVQKLEIVVNALLASPFSGGESIGFNGQAFRKRIFEDLLSAFRFEAIGETGTFTGNTTGHMAQVSKLPVYSTELDETFHVVARKRLAHLDNVHLERGDAREFLLRLDREAHLSAKCMFFYLDAHWNEDLPLKEEVEIICKQWGKFAIMIDDFQVPGDPGYGFDDYGPRKKLTIDYLSTVLSANRLLPFFPTAPSSQETGGRRGCVVLVRADDAARLDGVATLRKGTGW